MPEQGHYLVPPVWLTDPPYMIARPRPRPAASDPSKVWRITKEQRHVTDGDCWCGAVHLAMQSLTLDMLREFVERNG